MSRESQFEREMEGLEMELAEGTLTLREFNQAVRDLEREFSEYERECDCHGRH